MRGEVSETHLGPKGKCVYEAQVSVRAELGRRASEKQLKDIIIVFGHLGESFSNGLVGQVCGINESTVWLIKRC